MQLVPHLSLQLWHASALWPKGATVSSRLFKANHKRERKCFFSASVDWNCHINVGEFKLIIDACTPGLKARMITLGASRAPLNGARTKRDTSQSLIFSRYILLNSSYFIICFYSTEDTWSVTYPETNIRWCHKGHQYFCSILHWSYAVFFPSIMTNIINETEMQEGWGFYSSRFYLVFSCWSGQKLSLVGCCL